MNLRTFVILACGLIMLNSQAFGSSVIKFKGNIAFTKRPSNQMWRKGDRVCLHRHQQIVGCGTIALMNSKYAAIKLSSGADMAAVGDEVRLAGRNLASYVEGSISSQNDYSKGQISIELAGASLFYNIYGSYRFTKNFSINLGFSYFGASVPTIAGAPSAATVSVTQIPVSISWLAVGEENSFLEVVGGVNSVFASGSADFASITTGGSVVLPELGIGYRYWPRTGGFHFRSTLYAIYVPQASVSTGSISAPPATSVASSSVKPWLGLTFGYAF